ncbi:MAG: hypothetical protein WBW81_10465, partial [Methylocella sp.]
GCFRMVVEAQARSEAAFGGKWQIPAKNPPWRSSKPLAFPHGLPGICTGDDIHERLNRALAGCHRHPASLS